MWIRLLVIAGGVVMMITGCNSLISQFFGTHKLRTLDLTEAVSEGIADADFVRLQNLIVAEQYQIGDALHSTDKDIVVFPLLMPDQRDRKNSGQLIAIEYMGWSNVFDNNCHERKDCYDATANYVQGLVRPPNPKKTPSDSSWAEMGYAISEDVRYLQVNREPQAWYWNLLLFLGGIGLPLALEYRAYVRKQNP
ncbi:MAG: hypothetical protein AAF741_01815 [Bacteroidota bacterium]